MAERTRADSPTKTCTEDGCDRPLRARGLCAWHYKQQHRKPTRYTITCVVCGVEHESSRRDGKYCTDRCKIQHYRQIRLNLGRRLICPLPDDHPVTTAITARREEGRREAEAAREARAAAKVAKLEAWRTPRECPSCAGWFTPLYTSTAIHCSPRCQQKHGRRRRRAREAGASGSWVWSDFMRMAARFDYRCAYCERKPDRLDPDHVVPLSRGGYDSVANLLPACATCNGHKRNLLLHEWAGDRELRGLPPRITTWAPEDKRYHHLTQALLTTAWPPGGG